MLVGENKGSTDKHKKRKCDYLQIRNRTLQAILWDCQRTKSISGSQND